MSLPYLATKSFTCCCYSTCWRKGVNCPDQPAIRAAAGEPWRAVAEAVRYLQSGGREAEHYAEALDLINREGSLEPQPAAGIPAADEPRAGESRVFDGMEFAWVPAGEFLMGSTSAEADDVERPVTRVRISRGYWLGRHEVTQSEWQAVTGTNPSHNTGCGRCPVEEVSWEDAQEFLGRLNARAGGARYRLPTEAEWEYAARAGTVRDRYSANLDAIAWCDDNSGASTQPAGRKAPNAWGLHDMLGNVWEWVQDWYGGYPGGSVTDPRGPGSGSGESGQQLAHQRSVLPVGVPRQFRARQPQRQPRFPPPEDCTVALCAITLLPYAARHC